MCRHEKRWLFVVILFFVFENSFANAIKSIQIYNNLYNQAYSAVGVTATNVSIQFFNGSIPCDQITVLFRNYASEMVGAAGQSCVDVTSLEITANTSAINTALQIYDPTPVVVSLNDADYLHHVVIQDLGTGVLGAPASDGSIQPTFSATDGSVTSLGFLGVVVEED